MAELLGHSEHDPHGESFPLAEAKAGTRVCIRKVDDDAPVLDYLEERGLVPGRVLDVVETRALDGVVTVRSGEQTHALGQVLARAVFVQPGSLPA